MNSQVEAVLRGLDFYLEREAKQADAQLPESFPIHPADLALVQWGANIYPAIEKREKDLFYRGVRLVSDSTSFRVRPDIPSPNQKPDPAVQRHMKVLVPLCEHWDKFEKEAGQMPSRTYLSVEAMEDFAAGVPHVGESWERYLDTVSL